MVLTVPYLRIIIIIYNDHFTHGVVELLRFNTIPVLTLDVETRDVVGLCLIQKLFMKLSSCTTEKVTFLFRLEP